MTIVDKTIVCIACAVIALVLASAFSTRTPPGTALLGFEITDNTRNSFTLRTSFKPCEARVTNGQWTIHFKR